MNNFYLNPDIDMKEVFDSLELDSGTQIAELTENGVRASLEVRGEVRVWWNPDGDAKDGELYEMPSAFPNDLKEIIHSPLRLWIMNPNIYVGESNWFEVFYGEEGSPAVDGVCVDVENTTPDEIYNILHEIVIWASENVTMAF